MKAVRVRRTASSTSTGFSLIELLVSMVIALTVTLAITAVLLRSEGSKRSTTSVNDINQTGAYIAYMVDRSIRSAGSGFAQRWQDAFGCGIDASKGGTAILPTPGAFPAPFTNVPQTVHLAPVIIGKGMADTDTETRGDVLTVMSGTAGFGETPHTVKPGGVSGTQMLLDNTVGYRAGDLVLLADSSVSGCMLQQIATPLAGGALPFDTGAPYYKANGTNVNLTSFGASTVSIQLGTTPNNPPQLLLYGVGDNQTLFSYDLLQLGASADPVPIADGVVEMRALYGVDTTATPDGTLDAWIDPVAGSGYTQADLTDGSAAAQLKLRRIVAIRLGFILRTSLAERPKSADPANGYDAPATITLFNDAVDALGNSLMQTRTLTSGESHYRFRTFELTVPLRNVLLAPSS